MTCQNTRWWYTGMNVRKIGPHTWKVESRSSPEKEYTVYYKSCGGHCECKGFHYNKWCSHLDKVKELAETEEVLTTEERLFHNDGF